jgi:hypothetical protein
MLNRAALSTVFVLVALAAGVAGCGGGSSESSADSAKSSSKPSAPLSKQAFVKKADAVCTESQKRIETEFVAFLKKDKINESENGESAKGVEARGIEAIETIAIPQLSKQASELRKLEPPAEEKAKVDAYISAIEKEVEGAEQNPKSLYGPAKQVFAESDAAAKGIGFKVCAVHN